MSLSLDWVYEWLGILWDEFSAILINNGFILFSSIGILPAFVLQFSVTCIRCLGKLTEHWKLQFLALLHFL